MIILVIVCLGDGFVVGLFWLWVCDGGGGYDV